MRTQKCARIQRRIAFEQAVPDDGHQGRRKQQLRKLRQRLVLNLPAFNSALQLALTAPKLGIPKADGNATVIPRSYEDLVRSSTMSEARKKYWLGED